MHRLLKRRSVLTYIALIIIMSLFFMLLVSGISYLRMKDMYSNISKIYDQKLQTIIYTNNKIENISNTMGLIVSTSDFLPHNEIEKIISEIDRELVTMIININQMEMDKTGESMFNQLKDNYRNYQSLWDKAEVYLKLGAKLDTEDKGRFKEQAEKLLSSLDNFVNYSRDRTNNLKEKSRLTFFSNIPVFLTVTIVSCALLIIISIYLINSIKNSIKEVLAVLSKLTEGDDYCTSAVSNKNEFENMKNALLSISLKQEDIRQLSEINSELIDMNKKLNEHTETVKELAITKERNRFARDIHDNLGYSMVLLIKLLEVCYESYESDTDIVKEKLCQAITISKEGLEDLRRSVKGLGSCRIEGNNLVGALRNLFNDFSSSGVKVDFSFDGSSIPSNVLLSNTIYMLCQESLTNALKHGKAKRINVILQMTSNVVKLYVFNDGLGCKEIIKGNGLLGMEKRVKELNGNIIFGSDGERGFNINVIIPLGGTANDKGFNSG